ncbi:DUF6325 family protein [Herbiconiux moechotypicola]|uniref:DUF1269 domain-containing protein n=1 Tax=Herbiconiux moechotypicola TaxID=637393 RepID=A0ABP5Q589_9MICO|nr:DUF6325 family protein [Herbiconiux moechotypicola]MCS5728862.1 DUF6325 family protein [Herbiconiux moechotypicola]
MAQFTYGPVELILVGFEGERPGPEIVSAFEAVIDAGTVRLLDLLFVTKSPEGDLTVLELEEAGDEIGFGDLVLEATGLASVDDVEELAADIPAGSSAALLVVELLWAKGLAEKLAAGRGVVISSDRIPAPVVNEVMAAIAD